MFESVARVLYISLHIRRHHKYNGYPRITGIPIAIHRKIYDYISSSGAFWNFTIIAIASWWYVYPKRSFDTWIIMPSASRSRDCNYYFCSWFYELSHSHRIIFYALTRALFWWKSKLRFKVLNKIYVTLIWRIQFSKSWNIPETLNDT